METRPLTFVHLSDIHFQSGLSEVSSYDLDSPLRHHILRDLRHLRERNEFKHLDGILISGDIAYAGKKDEYEVAIRWIDEIAEVIGCDPGQVWCVPGNHDIDQSVQNNFPTIATTHAALRSSRALANDLRVNFDNETNGPLLFQPLETYNTEFGRKYGCQTSCKEPYWEDELPLNDGSRLIIRGINSSYCSSRADNENTAKLIVGPMQLGFRPEDDVTYLALCHHPPEWVLDGQHLATALDAMVHVQLFGHKHFHQHRRTRNSVILSSGAVHPARDQQEWDPRYYLLSLFVEGTGSDRYLRIRLYPRVWDGTRCQFLADRGCGPDQSVEETVKLDSWTAPAEKSEAAQEKEKASMVADRKRLLHQFMLLPYAKQVGIVRSLSLFSSEEMIDLTDTELFVQAFQRSRASNTLENLWAAVEMETKR